MSIAAAEGSSVTLDPDTIRLLRSLTHRVRLTLLSLTAPTKSRSCHKQKKAAKQTRRVLRSSQKAAKEGIGEGEGKESPERKTVGRGKGGKCRLLYQFCLFPPFTFPKVFLFGQRDAGPKHVAARKLAHSVRKTYSAFTNGTN